MNSIKIWETKTIFAALTGLVRKSKNVKTGPMLQLSVLVKEDKPTTIIKDKKDDLVCGDCALKGSVCYLNPLSLNGIWKAAVNLLVSLLPKTLDPVRFGTYGNPSKLPLSFVKKIAQRCKNWTGYIHDWEVVNPKYSDYFMASIDPLTAAKKGRTAEEDKRIANLIGYRTYRVISSVKELLMDEILCPHEEKGVQCIGCGLCCGNKIKAKNIAIVVGGAPSKATYFNKQLKEIK